MDRERRGIRGGTLLVLSLVAAVAGGRAVDAMTHAAVAARWAPIHYQDTDSSDYFSDLISRVDYDGDLVCTNNWDHLHVGDYLGDPDLCPGLLPTCHDAHQYPLTAAVYYSVVETCTHWFIIYDFFHPRDWDDGSFDHEHENDFEDVLVVVRKAGGGTLEALVAQAHNDYFSYVPSGSPFVAGAETIDGTLPMAEYPAGSGQLHPETAQEAKGHGAGAKGEVGNFAGEADRDGVVYFPSGIPEEPSSGNDRHVGYELVSFFEPGGLWERQLLEDGATSPETYHTWGTLRGDKSGGCGSGNTLICGENSAKAPWRQDDTDDNPYRGATALDPARFTADYFDGLGDFDFLYVENRYLTDLAMAGYGLGSEPEGYITYFVTMDGVRYPIGSGPPLAPSLFAKVAPSDADADGVDRCTERSVGTDPDDFDSDDDGTGDGDDAFPADPTESVDTDGDGMGDNADADDDNDGVLDADDVFPTDPTEWADADGDGTGDNADPDDDNDALPDTLDTAPFDPDADDDGLLDGTDVEFIEDVIAALPPEVFRSASGRHALAMEVRLEGVERHIYVDFTRGALRRLRNLLRRIDGCGLEPDRNDWVVDCAAQLQVRALVDLLIANLTAP